MTRRATTPTRAELLAVAGKKGGYIRSTAFAEKMRVHPRTIRRCFARGGLPGAKEQGERILDIPTRLLRLAEAYGLRQVERMARAGQIPAA
jgi:hypothetical protein